MASTLYQSIFEKGQGKSQTDTIIRLLTRYVGTLDPAIATHLRSVSNVETLQAWWNEALDLTNADSARRLIDKITQSSTS